MYKASIDRSELEIEFESESLSKGKLNGTNFNIDIEPINERIFSIIYKGKSYLAELVGEPEEKGKVLQLKINGKKAKVTLSDKYDLLLKSMGFDFSASTKLTSLKAPMPGKVIDILVGPGEEVVKGDGLVILEAMKMENIIKASGDGVIKEITVQQQNTVEKGELLIKFE